MEKSGRCNKVGRVRKAGKVRNVGESWKGRKVREVREVRKIWELDKGTGICSAVSGAVPDWDFVRVRARKKALPQMKTFLGRLIWSSKSVRVLQKQNILYIGRIQKLYCS